MTQFPSTLQSAGPGMVVNGTVIGTDNQGQTLLQTNAGVISLMTAATLTVGQQVSLQIQAAGSQLQAIILSTQPSSSGGSGAAATATLPTNIAPSATSSPASTVAPSVSTGPILLATVIGPAGAAVPPLPPASVPAAAPPQPGSAAQPATATSTTPSAPPAATFAAPAAPAAPVLQPLSQVPPFAAPPASAASPPSAPIAASAAAQTAVSPAPSAPAATAAAVPPSTSSNVAVSEAPVPAPPNVAAPLPPPPTAPSVVTNSSGSAPNTPASGAVAQPVSLVDIQTSTPAQPIAAAIARYAASSAGGQPATPLQPPSAGVVLPAAQTGTQIQLRFVGTLPTLSAATAGASAGQLVATVVGRTPAGQTILDTAIGHLALNLPPTAEFQAGSQLAFDIVGLAGRTPASPAGSALAAASGQPGMSALGPEWPTLKTALEVLAHIDPAIARQVLDVNLPHPGSGRFLGQILSFISSPAADARSLLGQSAVETLQHAGRGDLVSRLDIDLRETARLNAAPTDWRVFYVPIFDTTEARQLRVFTRRRKSDKDKRRDSGARFVVEVEYDGLGPLQLDGLIQKPRIDLILRSHVDLPAPLQAGITDVFGKTCEASGLAGSIFFQSVPSFPVSPLDEITKHSSAGMSI